MKRSLLSLLLPEKTARKIRRDGLRFTVMRQLEKAIGVEDPITRARSRVQRKIIELHRYVVAYGPFEGLNLDRDVWWGRYDLTTKMLGVYEEHVTAKLCELLKKTNGPFVDIGAADGYFALGVAVGRLAKQVYAYEISAEGRQKLSRNIHLNGCEDGVTVEAEANYESIARLVDVHENIVGLIDIEGAEYGFLDARMLELMRNSRLIVELHPWLVEDGIEKEKRMLNLAEDFFRVSFIERETYNPNGFSELQEFSDHERLLAFSEGRKRNMKWLVLEPKD